MTEKHYTELIALFHRNGTSLPSFILTFLEWWKHYESNSYLALQLDILKYLRDDLTKEQIEHEIESCHERNQKDRVKTTDQ